MAGKRAGQILAGLFVLAGCPIANPKYQDPSAATSGSESESESEPESESESSYGSTGLDSTTSDGSAGDTDGRCSPLGNRLIQFGGVLGQDDCESLTASIKIDTSGPVPTGKICLENCQGCLDYPFELDTLPDLFIDGECLVLEHRGIWKDNDPEAVDGCKTTFLGVFEQGDVPRYIASSRLLELPDSFPGDYEIEFEKAGSWECNCGLQECCPDDLVTQFEVEFRHEGNSITVAPGQLVSFTVGGYIFALEVLRAHSRGIVDEGTCISRNYLDWHMYRAP